MMVAVGVEDEFGPGPHAGAVAVLFEADQPVVELFAARIVVIIVSVDLGEPIIRQNSRLFDGNAAKFHQ